MMFILSFFFGLPNLFPMGDQRSPVRGQIHFAQKDIQVHQGITQRRPLITTVPPCCANSSALALPMPDVDPVTTATLSANLFPMSPSSVCVIAGFLL